METCPPAFSEDTELFVVAAMCRRHRSITGLIKCRRSESVQCEIWRFADAYTMGYYSAHRTTPRRGGGGYTGCRCRSYGRCRSGGCACCLCIGNLCGVRKHCLKHRQQNKGSGCDTGRNDGCFCHPARSFGAVCCERAQMVSLSPTGMSEN